MKKRSKKFQLRMYVADFKLLKALAAGESISMSAYLVRLVRREAKKIGIPKEAIPGD